MSAVLETAVAQRSIVLRTRGMRHGPITRLVSPSGESEIERIGSDLAAAGLLR